MSELTSLAGRLLAGDRAALSRLITLVENRAEGTLEVMSRLYGHAGRAAVIGLTGPPGAGKSTLVDRLVKRLRAEGLRVGVVAVDPSSPFSGGAVLGDRIRMQDHFLDDGVFIRSLSTRGRHGGLARATRDVARLLDAFGMDFVLVETVGVGQTELDVMEIAETTVVVLVPEAGDAVQVMKAGLLEIADVFVVNKADREGGERMASELSLMLHLRPGERSWKVPVVSTEAVNDVGLAELLGAIRGHLAHLKHSEHGEHRGGGSDARGAESRRREVIDLCEEEIGRRLREGFRVAGATSILAGVESGETDPYRAASEILADPARLAQILGVRRE